MATCFVVQGFGKKTDYTDGRVLDLDASYAVIKNAVEAAGLSCLRADEIVHSGTIDALMYEQLLTADLVIADLSTYNVNAAFELGVRYGLRPHATIVIAEEGFKPAFDVTHIVIRRYKHLGEDIGTREALRLATELNKAIGKILAAAETDSPVYTFLSNLTPPARRVARAVEKVETAALKAADELKDAPREPADNAERVRSDRWLLDAATDHMARSEFNTAKELLKQLHERQPHDHHVVHQLALATYKDKTVDARVALEEAKNLLSTITPATTNDPETLGLWGAVHKRLWDLTGESAMLDESIAAYSRGFYLKQDYYNGVNYAMLLELRALHLARVAGRHDDAVADRVGARRVREDVLRWLQPTLDDAERLDEMKPDARYWMLASAWEVCAGLGDSGRAADFEARARSAQPHPWMLQSTQGQIERILHTQATLHEALKAD